MDHLEDGQCATTLGKFTRHVECGGKRHDGVKAYIVFAAERPGIGVRGRREQIVQRSATARRSTAAARILLAGVSCMSATSGSIAPKTKRSTSLSAASDCEASPRSAAKAEPTVATILHLGPRPRKSDAASVPSPWWSLREGTQNGNTRDALARRKCSPHSKINDFAWVVVMSPPPSRQASIHSFPRGGGARNFWGSARRYTAHWRLSPRTNPRVAWRVRETNPIPCARSQIAKEPELRGRTAMRIKVCSGAALCQRICHIREQPIRSHRGAQPHHRDVNLCRAFSLPMDLTRPREFTPASTTRRLPGSTAIILRSLLSANGPHTSERSERKKALPARRRERFPQSPSGTIERNTGGRKSARFVRERRSYRDVHPRSPKLDFAVGLLPNDPATGTIEPNNFGASEYGVSLDSEGDCDVSA